MNCFVSAIARCRAREFTRNLCALLFAVAVLSPAPRLAAQSATSGGLTELTAARRDSTPRARRLARARARKAAAAKARRANAARSTRAAGASGQTAPAVSPRTVATGSGGGTTPAPTTSIAAPISTRTAPSSSSPPATTVAAGAGAGRSSEGQSTRLGTSGRGRAGARGTTASKKSGGTAIADGGPALGLYAGASNAGLGFGIGPTLGAAWRFAAPMPSLRLRADVMGSHYSQTASALAGGAAITQSASLTHLGATLSAELSLSSRRTLRPYLLAGGGVFRFQAAGPSGSNGTLANGVFASTTDAAAIAGLGVQLNPRFYVEARYLTVGDFHTIPITAGVRF